MAYIFNEVHSFIYDRLTASTINKKQAGVFHIVLKSGAKHVAYLEGLESYLYILDRTSEAVVSVFNFVTDIPNLFLEKDKKKVFADIKSKIQELRDNLKKVSELVDNLDNFKIDRETLKAFIGQKQLQNKGLYLSIGKHSLNSFNGSAIFLNPSEIEFIEEVSIETEQMVSGFKQAWEALEGLAKDLAETDLPS